MSALLETLAEALEFVDAAGTHLMTAHKAGCKWRNYNDDCCTCGSSALFSNTHGLERELRNAISTASRNASRADGVGQ